MRNGFRRASLAALGLAVVLAVDCGRATAAEVAPRISDREIVERLVRVEEGLKALRTEMLARFEVVEARFAGIDKRFDDLNRRIDMLMWMVGVFVTTATVVLGFVVRIQWQMNRRQAQTEATLEAHKHEIAFLKELIGKLLPPRGAL